MSWLHYLIEANIYLGVFYLCYCLFLNAETHYTLSRVYLLFSCVLSFILPVTQLSILKPVVLLELDQPMAYVPTTSTIHFAPPPPAEPSAFTWQDSLFYTYIIGAAIALAVFIFRLYQLYKLSKSSKQLLNNSYRIVYLQNDNTAFSFFNYLFIGTNVSQSNTIIAHELVHIRQKHSWDIMLLEIIKVINWFNPFIYLTQRSLKTVHEYIADEQTAAYERDALTYSSFLLNNAYGIQGSSLAHSFFNYNLLKKRIIMLNKNRSGKLARLKYLAVLPLCGGMLCASTLAFAKDYGWIDLSPKVKEHVIESPINVTGKPMRLKITSNGVTAISDKLGKPLDNGKMRYYTAKTLTISDQQYLKKRGFVIELIEQAEKDTTIHRLPPPPPPVMLRPAFHDLSNYLDNVVKYPKAAFNKKMTGSMVISFDLDANGKIQNLKSMGTPQGGFFEAIKAPIENYPRSIKEKAGNYKMGINFMILGKNPVLFQDPSIKNRKDYIGETIITGMTPQQHKLINQPIQEGKIIKRPPPPPPAPVEAQHKAGPKLPPPPPPLPPDSKAMPAPPPPHDTAYSTLFKYMGKHVRYPRVALDNKVTGNVVLSYRLDAGHKITDIKVISGIGKGCDEEVVRALKTFNNAISRTPDTYYFATTFAIDGYTKKFEPVGKISTRPNFAGIVVVMAYSPASKALPVTTGKVKPVIKEVPVTNTANNQQRLSSDKMLADDYVSFKSIVFQPGKNQPVIMANDKLVNINSQDEMKALLISADRIMLYFKNNEGSLIRAKAKRGYMAKNGVI